MASSMTTTEMHLWISNNGSDLKIEKMNNTTDLGTTRKMSEKDRLVLIHVFSSFQLCVFGNVVNCYRSILDALRKYRKKNSPSQKTRYRRRLNLKSEKKVNSLT